MRTELKPAVQCLLGEDWKEVAKKYLHKLEEETRKMCRNTTKERGEEERDQEDEDKMEQERKKEDNAREEEEEKEIYNDKVKGEETGRGMRLAEHAVTDLLSRT